MKKEFRFEKNGVEYGVKDIPHFEDKPRIHAKIMKAYQNFLTSQKPVERIWRNNELGSTDWMLMEDATFGGEPLVGSDKLAQIKAYRMKLRSYNLMDEPRPERPDWFK